MLAYQPQGEEMSGHNQKEWNWSLEQDLSANPRIYLLIKCSDTRQHISAGEGQACVHICWGHVKHCGSRRKKTFRAWTSFSSVLGWHFCCPPLPHRLIWMWWGQRAFHAVPRGSLSTVLSSAPFWCKDDSVNGRLRTESDVRHDTRRHDQQLINYGLYSRSLSFEARYPETYFCALPFCVIFS